MAQKKNLIIHISAKKGGAVKLKAENLTKKMEEEVDDATLQETVDQANVEVTQPAPSE